MSAVTDVQITCTQCGRRLELAEASEHGVGKGTCRPRWLYWYPRAHPWNVAMLALIVGLILGLTI